METFFDHGLIATALKTSTIVASPKLGIAASLPQDTKQVLGAVVGHSLLLTLLSSQSSPLTSVALDAKEDIRTFDVHSSAKFAAITTESKKLWVVDLDSPVQAGAEPQDGTVSGHRILFTGSAPKKVTSLQWIDDTTLLYSDKFGNVFSQVFDVEGGELKPKAGEPDIPFGHYSVVTELAILQPLNSNMRYIASSDKDEKIRISRWPHSYDINAALGLDVLVSTGGDNQLFVWNYLTGKKLFQLDLSVHVTHTALSQALRKNYGATTLSSTSVVYDERHNRIFISFEFLDAILVFEPTMTAAGVSLTFLDQKPLSIVPLKLALNAAASQLFVSGVGSKNPIQALSISATGLNEDSAATSQLSELVNRHQLTLSKEETEITFQVQATEENLKKFQSSRGRPLAHAGTYHDDHEPTAKKQKKN